DPGKELKCHGLDWHRGHHEQEGEYGEAERDRDRHAGQHQRNQQSEDEGRSHCAGLRTGVSTSMPSTSVSSVWGRRPVRQKFHATCKNRKHIRYEPSGTAKKMIQRGSSRSADTWSVG